MNNKYVDLVQDMIWNPRLRFLSKNMSFATDDRLSTLLDGGDDALAAIEQVMVDQVIPRQYELVFRDIPLKHPDYTHASVSYILIAYFTLHHSQLRPRSPMLDTLSGALLVESLRAARIVYGGAAAALAAPHSIVEWVTTCCISNNLARSNIFIDNVDSLLKQVRGPGSVARLRGAAPVQT